MTIASAFLATSQPAWRSQRFSPRLWFLFRSHRNPMRSTLERRPPGNFCPTRGDLYSGSQPCSPSCFCDHITKTACLKSGIATVQREFLCLLTGTSFVVLEERRFRVCRVSSNDCPFRQPSQQFLKFTGQRQIAGERIPVRSVLHLSYGSWRSFCAPGFPEGIGL